ncbi:hypothetical protein ABK249_15200 [Neorhizobium sp. Rsf11]|uniref:Uncharacterized protein n=2 Tax=Neorhizobium TaxID=1525371 RepID=A0ABV0M4A8_9HYPH|nr:hypothetical protein [Neorhizobium petrolearium]MCC2609463.1 hypothetical protein [Neorhizobium petrolearium]WGI69672.1 hypothetical protein QEO92_06280 [Neorhizobium petrolearium]
MRIAKAHFLTLVLAGSLPVNLYGAEALRVVGPWEITGIVPAQTGYVFNRLQAAETLVTTDKQGALVSLVVNCQATLAAARRCR